MSYINRATAIVITIFAILTFGCSRILIVDPPRDQRSITTPHDLVVAHHGCGTTDSDSLQAHLDKDQPGEIEITDAFHYDSHRDAWIAEEHDLPSGQHTFGARAHVSADGFCYRFIVGETFELNINPSLGPGEYESLLHHYEDVDSYTIKAPTSNFGSWFEIIVEAIDPPDSDLHVKLLGPQGSHLESATQSSTKFWIALKTGVEAKIMVGSGDVWPEGQRFVTYKVNIASNIIPDNLEDDDIQTRATQLTYNGTQTAYMCGVLDSNEEPAGLPDWYKYTHRSCRDDCIEVSENAHVYICISSVPGDCEGCDGHGRRVCMKADGCIQFLEAITRYVNVLHPEHYNYLCYGLGDVPSHYRFPYTVRLVDNGDVGEYGDCQ
jgi:hypothetical protein